MFAGPLRAAVSSIPETIFKLLLAALLSIFPATVLDAIEDRYAEKVRLPPR